MFDISWSELLVIGIVALLVVGPKELPALLRTIGRYFGIIKRQAADFRAQFDEAMREAELDQVKKDMENLKTQAETTLQDTERTISGEFGRAQSELDSAAASAEAGRDQTVPAAAEAVNGTTSSNGTAVPGMEDAKAAAEDAKAVEEAKAEAAAGSSTPAATGGDGASRTVP